VIDRSTVCPVRISGVPGQAITFNLMNSFGEAAAPGRLLAALQAGLRHPDQLRLRAPPRLMTSQNSHFAWHARPLPSQPSGLGPPTGRIREFSFQHVVRLRRRSKMALKTYDHAYCVLFASLDAQQRSATPAQAPMGESRPFWNGAALAAVSKGECR
jgi:hypothetical protein